MNEWDHRSTREVETVSGACVLLRRAALDGRLFRDDFYMYGEDVELCRRLRDERLARALRERGRGAPPRRRHLAQGPHQDACGRRRQHGAAVRARSRPRLRGRLPRRGARGLAARRRSSRRPGRDDRERQGSTALRVLLVAAATGTTGGGERHVADLLEALPDHDIDVALACPPGGDLGTAGRRPRRAPVRGAHRRRLLDGAAGGAPRRPRRGALGRRARARLASGRLRASGRHARAPACRLPRPRHPRRQGGDGGAKGGHAGHRAHPAAAHGAVHHRLPRRRGARRADRPSGGRADDHRVQRRRRPGAPGARSGRFRAELGVPDAAPLVLSRRALPRPEGPSHAPGGVASGSPRARPDAVLALVGSGALGPALRAQARAGGIAPERALRRAARSSPGRLRGRGRLRPLVALGGSALRAPRGHGVRPARRLDCGGRRP